MRVAIKDHLDKAVPLARALAGAGHEVVPPNHAADLLLIDLDEPKYGFRRLIDAHKDAGATVLMYPHGANPQVAYDGFIEPYEEVDGNLVIAAGHAEVMRRYGYPVPVHVIGWSLCDPVPFRPCGDVRRVLFAPTHPSGHGHLSDPELELNARHFEALLAGPWELTVRYLGTLEQNGLWEADGVRYSRGDWTVATDDIDAADLVVAAPGTFPALTVARGTPLVTYGQGNAPNYGEPGEELCELRNADRYGDYLRYPFDAADGPLDEVVHAAARSEEPIAEWRRRFIGEPMDDGAVAELIETIVDGRLQPLTVDDARGFSVAAFADELLERPELLAAYARSVAPEDDTTLLVWGPGMSPDALLAMTERAVAAASLDVDRLPDIVLLPFPASREADRRLAEIADALLSEWPAAGRVGELARYEPTRLAPAA